MTRVFVKPDLLRWARERARLDAAVLQKRFPKLADWEAGTLQPTVRQLEDYARATHAPVGFFFLPEPPAEVLPIPDFRTIGDRQIARPSANLLDTVYACQERQGWYRDYALTSGLPAISFIGTMTTATPVLEAAGGIRRALGFSVDARRDCRTWEDALRLFIEQIDTLGVMVMVSGVVFNNTSRPLDPEEFRGFALCDDRAPLIFVNGADSKAAQMFTLAHELAHLWLGQTALSDVTAGEQAANAVEIWCNQVAAELLVPMNVFRTELEAGEEVMHTMRRLARRFKVSSLVILRRLLDAGLIGRNDFFRIYRAEVERIRDARPEGGGGDFYRTTASRVSKRFARALVESTLEGRTLYRDAFRMLGVSKTSTFNELGRSLNFYIGAGDGVSA